MGTIQYYNKLLGSVYAKQPEVLREPKDVCIGKPILQDAINVTLVEYDTSTKDAITAHRIKDYRRKRFNLRLLPKVNILFDHVLEGSSYWNELLHNESAYS